MDRGDIFRVEIDLPNRSTVPQPATTATYRTLAKYVVVLQGGTDFAGDTDVAVVVASSLHQGVTLRPFEVLVGTAEGFHHDTVIDCRWPYTITKDQINAGRQIGTLTEAQMHSVSLAVLRGLQLR